MTCKWNSIWNWLLVAGFVSFFVACGDDSSTSGKSAVEPQETAIYDSVEDLPVCNKRLRGEVVKVEDDLYNCTGYSWIKLDLFANGVCNIQSCSEKMNEKYVYVKDKGESYQCIDGEWVDKKDNPIETEDFLDCFMLNVVLDTLESEEDLPGCSNKLNQELVYVDTNLYSCINKNWVALQASVVAENDLPKCKKDSYAFVMSKMVTYECRSGIWYNGDEPVKVSAVSSSSAAADGEGNVEDGGDDGDDIIDVVRRSSSSKAETPSTDDPTQVRGVCMPVSKTAEKGAEVEWKFTNMGGTPVSYEWTFDENSPVSTSDDKRPVVTYTKLGKHTAKLVVNKGLESESEEIICSDLTVSAVQVNGCECILDKSEVSDVSPEEPGSATWKVQGCSGAAPFTYEWSGSAFGAGASETVSITSAGTYSASVKVHNSEGGSASLTCPSVSAKGKLLSRGCAITGDNQFLVKAYSWSNWNRSEMGSEVRMTLKGDDGTSENFYVTYNSDASIDLGLNSGAVNYALVYGGDTVCTTASLNCGPENVSIENRGITSWKLNSAAGYSPKSYLWTFSDGTTSTSENPFRTYSQTGSVSATLLLDKGLSTEKELTCNSLKVEPAEITDCSCSSPKLVTATNDVVAENGVAYKWFVSGCSVDDGSSLSYEWSAFENVNTRSVTGVYYEKGSYAPSVKVTSKNGASTRVSCPVAMVTDSDDPYMEIAFESLKQLSSGNYYIPSCPDAYRSTTEVYFNASTSGCESWFSEYERFNNFLPGYTDECNGYIVTTFPLYITVPAGQTLTLRQCF